MSNQEKSNELRKKVEEKILNIIKDEPDISINSLRERLGGSNVVIGTVYMKIRRDMKRKRRKI